MTLTRGCLAAGASTLAMVAAVLMSLCVLRTVYIRSTVYGVVCLSGRVGGVAVQGCRLGALSVTGRLSCGLCTPPLRLPRTPTREDANKHRGRLSSGPP